MNYKQEEQRVKGVLAGLVPVQPHLGHTRAKWDSRTTSDLKDVIETISIFQGNSIMTFTDEGKIAGLLGQPTHVKMTTHFSGPVLAMSPQCVM